MEDHLCQGRVRAPGPVAWDPRYRTLDAWRGLACLLVVVHHAGLVLGWQEAEGSGLGSQLRWLTVLSVRGMSLGVSIFFVISGYCIAASVESTRRKGGSPWGFMGRRFWRIYPPYWAAVLAFVAVVVALDAGGLGRLYQGSLGICLDPPRALDTSQWLGNLTLTETWRPYVWGAERNVYTGVAWSLCFEEQFYLICFLALWLAPRRVYATLGAVTLAILGVRIGFWWAGGLWSLRGTFPLLWHEFAVGLVVFYRLNVARGALEKRGLDAGLVALLLVGLTTRGGGTVTASAFGLVLVALRRWDARAAGYALLAPFGACGRRCYSIYLVHLPFVVVGSRWLFEVGVSGFWTRALVMVPLVSAAGVAGGWAFHAIVETHFLAPPRSPVSLGHAGRVHGRRWRTATAGRAAASTVAT